MRHLTLCLAAAAIALSAATPPSRIEFPSKRGTVVFLHDAHARRENPTCATCHDKLWPQSTAAPLTSSAGCHTCHAEGGKAFSAKSRDNCVKCHPAPASPVK